MALEINLHVHFSADSALTHAIGSMAEAFSVKKILENGQAALPAATTKPSEVPAPVKPAKTDIPLVRRGTPAPKAAPAPKKEEGFVRPSKEEIRKIMLDFIGTRDTPQYQARSQMVQEWLHAHNYQTVHQTTDEELAEMLELIRKEAAKNA